MHVTNGGGHLGGQQHQFRVVYVVQIDERRPFLFNNPGKLLSIPNRIQRFRHVINRLTGRVGCAWMGLAVYQCVLVSPFIQQGQEFQNIRFYASHRRIGVDDVQNLHRYSM